MFYIYDLLLEDGTIGKTIGKDITIGDFGLIELQNENGYKITVYGTVKDILNKQELGS